MEPAKFFALMATIWSVATFATGMASHLYSLLIARFLTGSGEAGFAPGGTAWLSLTFSEKSRSRVFGIFNMGIPIGSMSEMKLGAILVTNKGDSSLGIVSKTDLLLANIQGARLDEPAQTIMNFPVNCCNAGILLSDTIQQMLLYDVQRIFLTDVNNGPVIGVLSLSDATRFRSGTCRACGAGRILGNFLSYSE